MLGEVDNGVREQVGSDVVLHGGSDGDVDAVDGQVTSLKRHDKHKRKGRREREEKREGESVYLDNLQAVVAIGDESIVGDTIVRQHLFESCDETRVGGVNNNVLASQGLIDD